MPAFDPVEFLYRNFAGLPGQPHIWFEVWSDMRALRREWRALCRQHPLRCLFYWLLVLRTDFLLWRACRLADDMRQREWK